MNARKRCLLINVNRTLIFVLSLAGLLMDSFQFSDLPCAVALLVWLWLPQCARLEANLLGWTTSRRGHVGSAKVFPSV